jgi:hypothetical protein
MQTSPLAGRPRQLPETMRIADAGTAEPGRATAAAGSEESGFDFRDVLSMLNPLQYLPVLGSIYRAVTGDTIPEAVRDIGSLVVSGLWGGPMGVAISAATTALEKLAGIDPDRIAQKVLASIGLIGAEAEAAPQLAAREPAPAEPAQASAVPWTRAQRRAYQVRGAHPLSRAPSLTSQPLADADADGLRRDAALAYAQAERTAPVVGRELLQGVSA